MPVKPLVAVRRGEGADRRWFVVLLRDGWRTPDVVQGHRWRWTSELAARRLARRLSSRTVAS